MPIDRIHLPHGVTLPTTLAEPDGRALVDTLARHYGWHIVLLGRNDIEEQLTGNLEHPSAHSPRQLTGDEWSRVRATSAWTGLPATVHRAIGEANVIGEVIRQAALECRECDAPLTGPPTATWGYCPVCLHRTSLDDLRRRPCPAAGADISHQWNRTTCTTCGIPRIDSPARPRRLTAVRPVA